MKRKKRQIISLLIIFSLLVGVYLEMTLFSLSRVSLRFETVVSEKVPPSFHNASIGVISDVNGNISNLNKAVDHLKIYQPDIVVFSGNLFDETTTASDEVAIRDLLTSIPDKLGKYAVLGSGDIPSSNDTARQTLQTSGFRILDNSVTPIHNQTNESIQLVGLNTNASITYPTVVDGGFVITVAHNPDVYDSLRDQTMDVMITGKSMNGKIRLPLIGALFPSSKYNEKRKQYDETIMIQSSGVGTSKPEFRLFTNPDVVIIRLQNPQ
ncbi:metallophosphoesterase [Erysipelothrix aquatica]|uniref:metallophosphoesterase n=1 Tax=Erysipelothrix aquatica TaxID=2683714 RepID=UPI001359039C|nr:metallophosphoesterase [Erysipelothrix aquatica]